MAKTNSTARVNKQEKVNVKLSVPVAAGETIIDGVICIVSGGYLYNMASGVVGIPVIAREYVDNSSGSAGDVEALTEYGGAFEFTFGAVAQTDVGGVAYIVDNDVLANNPADGAYANQFGTIIEWVSTTKAIVSLNSFNAGNGEKIVIIPLVAGTTTTGGDVISWVNPENIDIQLTQMIINVDTPATGVATMDVGVAADGVTTDDDLYDGLDIGSAAIIAGFGSGNHGTNGRPYRKLASGEYVTGTPSATAAGLVGSAVIKFVSVS